MKSGQLICNGSSDQLRDAAVLENIYDILMRVLGEPVSSEAFAFARLHQSSPPTRY